MKPRHLFITLLTLLLVAHVQRVQADEDTPRVLISTSTCSVNGHMLFPWVSPKQAYFSVLIWYLNTKQNNSYWKEAPTLTIDGHSVKLKGIQGDDPIEYDPDWDDDFGKTLACRDGETVHYWVRWRDSFKVKDATLPTSMSIGGGTENVYGRNDDHYIVVDVIFPTNREGDSHKVSVAGKFTANHKDKGMTNAVDFEGLATLETHKTNSPFATVEASDDLTWTAPEMLKLKSPKFTKQNAWGRYLVDYDGMWSDKTERGVVEMTKQYSNPKYQTAEGRDITYYQYTAIDWADTTQTQGYTEHARFRLSVNGGFLRYDDMGRGGSTGYYCGNDNNIWLNRIEPCGVRVSQRSALVKGVYGGVTSGSNMDLTFKCLDLKHLTGVTLLDLYNNTICEWHGDAQECVLTVPGGKEVNVIDLTFDRYAYGMAVDFVQKASVKSNTFPKPGSLSYKTDAWAKSVKLSWEAENRTKSNFNGTYVIWRDQDSICAKTSLENNDFYEYTDYVPAYDKEYKYSVSFEPKSWDGSSKHAKGLTTDDAKVTVRRQLDLSELTVAPNEDSDGYQLKWQLRSATNSTEYYFKVYRIVVTPDIGVLTLANFTEDDYIDKVDLSTKDANEYYSYTDLNVNSTDTYAYLVSIHVQETDFYTGPAIPSGGINSSHIEGSTATCGTYTDKVVVRWEAAIMGQDEVNFCVYRHRIQEGENYVNSIGQAQQELKWDSLGMVVGRGSDSEHSYCYEDSTVLPGVYYTYAIKAMPNGTNQQTTLQWCTGFARATATVRGHVTYQSGKYAVEGVRVLVDATATDGEGLQQFRALGLSEGGGVHWTVPHGKMNNYFGGNGFSVQMYACPADSLQGGSSLLDMDGRLRIGLGDYQTGQGYPLKVLAGSTEQTTELLRIKPGQFTSITFTYDKNRRMGWIYLLGRDSIGCMATDSVLNVDAIAWAAGNSHVAVGSLRDSTQTMQGYVDEVRFWDKALSQTAVLKNYNHVLGGNEEGLVAYWTFDESISTMRVAYDYSMTGAQQNENHAGIVCGVRDAEKLPTSDQFGLFGMTDASGYYAVPGIPLIGNETNYDIIPSKGAHEFTPNKENITVSKRATEFEKNFTDVSSFNVKGFVYYENTTYPVDSCMFYIDDSEEPLKDTNDHIVRSNGDGAFTISVPIGEHYIRVEKADHVFKNDGRYPEPGTLHNFNDSISHLTFTDLTKVVLAGRVVGGNVERIKPLGFGQSNANIGAATLTLIPSTDIRTAPRMNVVFNDQEGTYDDNPQRLDYETVQQDYITGCTAYTPGGYATDSLKMIVIHTDPASGEFAVKVPPIDYTIATRMDHNDNVTFDDKEVVNASNVLRCDTARVTTEDGEALFCYQAAYIPQYLSTPVISVRQKGNEVGAFGDEKAILKRDDSEQRDTVTIYSYQNDQLRYLYDYPIFSFGEFYEWTIAAYQSYVNYDSGEAVETREPTSGTVMVQNEMYVGNDTLAVGVLDSLGTYQYAFTGLLPNIESPYTRVVDIGVQMGEDVFKWDGDGNGGPLKGILFGPVKTGTSFVTKAPDEVINILRDPYGNGSYTTWEEGSSISHSYKLNSNTALGFTGDESGDLGINVSILWGVPTCLLGDKGIVIGKYALNTSLDLSLSHNQVMTWNTTTTKTISTATDAAHVGSNGDVFIGLSTAVCFGDGKNVEFINNQQGGWRVGTTDALVLGDSLTTDFVYSQYFIVNQMIPELRDMRNAMLQTVSREDYDNDVLNFVNNSSTEPIYKTWRTPDDPDFGAPNDTLQLKENTTNRCIYGDSYAVFFPESDQPFMEDMVNDCNQQIMNWENLLALNEEDKVMAMTRYYNDSKVISLSFETGSQESGKSDQTHNLTEGMAFKHDANGAFKIGYRYEADLYSQHHNQEGTWGLKLNRMRQPGYELATSSHDAYTYSLRETANDNSHQVTFYPSPSDYSFVCIQTGGQTSQPYEGADKSRYYEPGQHSFSVATKQIEVPTIHVDKYIVSGVPAGGAATFNLTLTNPTDAQVSKPIDFDLWVGNDKFAKMARVTFNGNSATGNKFPVKLDSTNNYKAEVALQVAALTEDIIHIDSLHLFFSSNGQSTIRDDVYLGIHFQPHAESVKLAVTPDLVNTATDSTLTLRAYDYDINSKILDAVKLQQRLAGSNQWTTLRRWVRANPVGSNESLLTESCDTVISMRSEIFYPDATYEFRAVTECSQQGEPTEGASDIITVVKDITLPKPLYLPEPADGVLGTGDNITVTFDEDIFPSLREADNFIVQSVLNTDSIAHEVALRLDGTQTPVATTQTGLTLGGTSFTICTWLKHDGQGGTVLRHGEGTNAFRINIDAQGHLVAMITDEDGTAQPYTSTLTIPASLWVYLGATYNISTGSLSAWYCSGDDDVTLMSGVPVGKKAASKGNIYLGENMTGAMHELSLYTTALDWYTGIKPQMYLGKSYSTPSLVGYWRLDEGHGSTSEDRARGRHMLLASSNSWYLENENIAMALDGNSHAAIPLANLSTAPDDSYLIELWARTDGEAASDSVQIFGIDDKQQLDLNVVKGQLQLVAKGLTMAAIGNWTADEWHHVALNVLRTGTTPAFNLIVDGISVLSANADKVPALSGANLYLGRGMQGAIDEVRLWHGTHTQNDIVENMYNRMDPKDAGGLVGYYPMEYTHYDDYNQRVYEFSLRNLADGAIEETAIVAVPETGTLAMTTETPGLKSAPHKSNLDIDYAVKDNVVTITLEHSAAALEDCTVSTTLLRYYDLHNNIGAPITWTFRVKQNPLLWETDKKEVSVLAGQGGSFTARLTNYGVDDQQWQFPELPSWLQASQTSGIIPPNGYVDITFTVSDSNPIGKYFATVSARTAIHQNSGNSTLDTPLDISLTVEGERPNWTVASYPLDMTVTGQICINGITSTDTDDMVGAFIYDKKKGKLVCVGKGQPTYNNQRDAYYVNMMVIKGNNDMNGTSVNFRIYDASTGKTYPLVSTTPAVVFNVDDKVGTTESPVIWQNEQKLLQTEPIEKEWSSISLYLKPDTESQHLFDILGDHIDELYVDKNTVLTHSNGQWSASYSPIKPGQMMKVYLNTADTLYVIGDEVKPTDWPQTIAKQNSTWIGVPTQAAMTLDEAFAGIEPEEGDVVKDDDCASVFENNHWTGALTAILPGRGYVYTSMANQDKTLVFPAKSESGLSTIHTAHHGLTVSRKYAHSMVALCTVHGDYQETLRDAVIEVYDQNGELRGRTRTLVRDSLHILFISGQTEGEPLLIAAQLTDGRKIVRMMPQGFQPDRRLGTLRSPFVIDTTTDGIETLQLAKGMMAVYTLSGILVYNGPAADFHHHQPRSTEPLIVIETTDDGRPRVYKMIP